jgi:concanavalin A-like lectin/glucanase superfamily protein
MERGQIVFVGVVVAALGLFGLKLWSDQTADSALDSESRVAAARLARAGGLSGAPDTLNRAESASDGGYSRPGGPLRAGGPSGSAGIGGGRGGPDGHGGGSAEVLRAGGSRVNGVLGSSGSASSVGGSGGGSGGAVNAGVDSGGRGVPKAAQKQNLVDFLSAQPPTQADLAPAKTADGEDVALKLDKPEDISKQGGQAEDVQQADGGDGIKVGDTADIKFPNNVSPDAATISFKIQPDWSGSDQTDNALLELRGEHDWSNRIELVKNGDFLRFIVTPNSGQESDISVRITDWQAGDQHDVQASYGDGKTSLYIDGRLAGSNQYTGQLQFADNIPLHFGSDYPGSNYGGANSTFHNVSIINPNTPGK